MPVKDSKEARDFIRQWIEARKVSAGDDGLPAPEGFSFRFSCKNEVGIPFSILQPEIWERSVLVVAEVTIDKSHRKILESLRPKDRDDFLWNLKREITFAPATPAFAPATGDPGITKGVQFSNEICYDGLSETKLSEAMRNVTVCVIHVIDLFSREFGKVGGE